MLGPLDKWILSLFLFAPLFSLLHELGHAAMLRLAGNKAERIALGVGPLLFRAGAFEFRLLPFGGRVAGAIPSGWPGVSVALGGLMTTWTAAIFGLFVPFVPVEIKAAWLSLALFDLTNLIPFRGWDGWFVIRALREVS